MGHPKRRLSVPETIEPVDGLPLTVGDLAGFALMSHCDRCGRVHRVYPSPRDLHPRMRLVDLIGTLFCQARRGGRACGGRPRRLILAREGHGVAGSLHHLSTQWTLDETGAWVEDETLFWEAGDFEPLPARRSLTVR
jgi:hypothetical protein